MIILICYLDTVLLLRVCEHRRRQLGHSRVAGGSRAQWRGWVGMVLWSHVVASLREPGGRCCSQVYMGRL